MLFEGTFRDNIEVGRPGATLDEVIEAAKKAQIHETILNKGGYDAEVYEQGKNLSLGQRQRIAIARAILRDAPILILDEPTASLDVEAEGQVMRALDQLITGRTVIMISHRLSTLGHVDEIIVVKDGTIVEQGTYKELKRMGGVFAMLLEEQNRYNIERIGEESAMIRSAYMPAVRAKRAKHARSATQPLPSTSPSEEPVPSFVEHVEHIEHTEQTREPVEVKELVAVGATSATNDKSNANGTTHNGYHDTPVSYTSSPSNNSETPVPTEGLKLLHLDTSEDDEDPTERLPRAKTPTDVSGSSSSICVQVELDGEIIGERALDKPVLWIGRLLKNDIHIPDRRISLKHARIVQQRNMWVLEDIDSFNGIVHQGKRVEQHTFVDGDKVYLAPTIALHYHVVS